MGPLVFRRFGDRGLGRFRLGGRGTGVGRKGGSDRGRGSRECRSRGEVGFIAAERVARFIGTKPGDMVLSSTVEAHVLGDTPGGFFGREPWSEGAKVHGTWVGAGGCGLDGDTGCLRGRGAGSWASISFCLLCTIAIVEALEVGGELPIGFRDLGGKGKSVFDLVAQASREFGFLCSIVPLGVGHMA